jgi:hypothetical protein
MRLDTQVTVKACGPFVFILEQKLPLSNVFGFFFIAAATVLITYLHPA